MGMPALRISWRWPRQLREVAAALRMSIVAVDGRGRITGQIAPGGTLAITPSAGPPAAYSNRVRTLPRGFFGPGLGGQAVKAFWILVPSDVDRRVIAAQRTAIAAKGLTPRQVRAMEGRFEQTGRTYRFVVTDLTAR